MKSSFLACILSVLLINSTKAQEEFSYTGKTSLPKIISTLFNGQWNGTACVWKPNFYEKSIWGASYDGMLYTMPDTVMMFRTSNAMRLILVLSTRVKLSEEDFALGNAEGAGLSIAIFNYDKAKGKIMLESFEKFSDWVGSFDAHGNLSIILMANDDFLLSLSDAYINMGYYIETQYLYHRAKRVLSFTKSENNEGADSEEGIFSYDTESNFDSVNKLLILTQTGTIAEQNETGISVVKSILRVDKYRFEENKFEKICP
jgi:hypothetical protein